MLQLSYDAGTDHDNKSQIWLFGGPLSLSQALTSIIKEKKNPLFFLIGKTGLNNKEGGEKVKSNFKGSNKYLQI